MTDSDQEHRTDWPQVVLAAISQNLATGLAFGSFGTLILAIEQEYKADRSTSSLAISLMVVSLSVTASILGRMINRLHMRKVMIAGAILGAVGFAAASFAPGSQSLLAAYFLLLGPATALHGVLPSSALASNWAAPERRGLALGIVNMPMMVMVVPLLLAPFLHDYGVRAAYRTLAVADVALVPLLLLVRSPAPEVDRTKAESRRVEAGLVTVGALLHSYRFWILIVAQGLIAGAGTMKLAHFVPLLVEQGRSFDEANTLLAISGGAGVVGSFLFGFLADRIGGARAIACNAAIQAMMWTIFLAPVSFGVLLADAIVVGACGAGIQSAFSVILLRLFGEKSFGLSLGLASLLTLPFLFGLTPIASLLYQSSGSYHLPMGMMIGGLILSGVLFLSQASQERLAAKEAIQGA